MALSLSNVKLIFYGESFAYSRTVFFSTRQYGHRGVPHPGQLIIEILIPEVGQQQQAHMYTSFFLAYDPD